MPSRTRCSAASSRTTRCIASTPPCRRSSEWTVSATSSWTPPSRSSVAASTRPCRSGVRLELDELQLAELRETLLRDLEGFVRDEATSPLGARAAAARGRRSAPSARRRSCSAAWRSATASRCRERSTGSTSTRSARAASSRTTSREAARTPRAQIDSELRLQIPLYLLVLRDLVGVEPIGGIYRRARRPAGAARDAAIELARGPARFPRR